LSLASEIGPSRASLEQVLSHTSGHWTLVPDCVGTFAELCDEERTPAAVAAEPPLLAPGTCQYYTPIAYGQLVAHACRSGGSSMRRAWSAMAEAALPGRGGALSLTAPEGDEVAEVWPKMRNPTIADFAADMLQLYGAML